MEVSTETPSVLQIASMFASLSAQHRRVAFAAKGSASTTTTTTNVATTSGGRQSSIDGVTDTLRSLNANTTTPSTATTTTKSAVFYSDRVTKTTTENGIGERTRSRSSDSRPTCLSLDLKSIDNKAKFVHAKTLFENLERQSRQEQRQRTPHNNKKRVASPSPTRSSSIIRNEYASSGPPQHQLLAAGEPLATTTIGNGNNGVGGGTAPRVGPPPAMRTVSITKREQQIRPAIVGGGADSCVVASETATFVAMNNGGCSTTTITTTTRLVSASSAAAASSTTNSPSTHSAPPPVPPKPKFVDSPRTSSESSSTVGSPSQVPAGRSGFQRPWMHGVDASHLHQRNGSGLVEKSPPPTATSKEELSSVHPDLASSDKAIGDGAMKNDSASKGGGIRSYFSKITQQRRVETENGNGTTTAWPSSVSAEGDGVKPVHGHESKPLERPSAISVNTTFSSNSQPPDIVSPDKSSSLYEPYWRSNRFGRQRLANGESGHERSLSPPLAANSLPNESSTSQINPKRNYMLKSGSTDSTNGSTTTTGSADAVSTLVQSKHDPGKLEITWPPSNTAVAAPIKSPTDENKDSGVGTDSPSTSTTDSRASSSMNAAPPVAFSNVVSSLAPSKVEEESANVAFMTKEEASVLLSPSTRDVVLRETRGRVAGDDGEVRSLPSHLSIPQDVDLKRLSMCSMDSSSEHGGMSADRYSIHEDSNITVLPDGHFWVEISGLEDEPPPSPSEAQHYKKPSRVKFSSAPIRVFSTYTGIEYDRRNDDVDPVSASAEYELERRLEKMDLIDVELQKGAEGLGFSIIGMGVGADAGLEKLGIFVKSITPGGALHRDGRVCVCDQIVEVDGKSLVGVSQNYAASVLRSTSGIVKFKIGREKDLENSEIAALIRQSLEQDRIMRDQEEIFQRRFNGSGELAGGEMQETARGGGGGPPHDQDDGGLPQYYQQHHNNYNSYLLQPPWTNNRTTTSHESPLPSTDSVFAHDDDDETPEQLVDNDPHIQQLMTQLREPVAAAVLSSSEKKESSKLEGGLATEEALVPPPPAAIAALNSASTVESLASAIQTTSSPSAFRDSQAPISNGQQGNSTYTAAEDISRLLSDSAQSEDMETRFPSNGAEPEPMMYSATAVQSSYIAYPSPKSAIIGQQQAPPPSSSIFGQLRRTTPELMSSLDSLNGSEIQLRINSLEAELTDIRQETDKYQTLLNDSKSQYDNLDLKYSRAKQLIKNYQDREKDLLDREEAHLRQLREKDQQYANLVKMLKDKVVELEKQLHDAHRKRASIVEAQAAASAAMSAAAAAANQSNTASTSAPTPSDISPALAYLPAKKLESTSLTSDRGVPSDNSPCVKLPNAAPTIRNVPIIVQASTHPEFDARRAEQARIYGSDFGVPQTELLDSTAAKCKAEVVKQSQTMAARALPTRRKETEVFIMCHHTLEHAHALRAHGAHCGSGTCNNATASPCLGHVADCSLSPKSTPSPSKSSSASSTGSPLTPRRLTARAALLLRKKAAVNNATVAPPPMLNRHMEVNSSAIGVGGGDLEKVPAVLTWTCDDVCRFLKSIGLEKYTPEFSINRMDGCKLLQLDGSKLKAMGVQNHSDRALIKKQIKDMKAQIERERKQLEKESRRLHKLEKEKRQNSIKS